MAQKFGYYVNLDERGEFYADVRNTGGETVFEIRISDAEDSNIVEDGFMAHKNDVRGLEEHLADLGVIGKSDEVLTSAEFERQIEKSTDQDMQP